MRRDDIEIASREFWTKLRIAEAALKKRRVREKQERRAIKAAAGGPCTEMTKLGRPCRRRAMGNGRCLTHGGKDAMQLWLARKRERQAAEASRSEGRKTATDASP